MKKFSKMLALGMAAALAFGMTVSAAESPSTNAAEIVGAVLGETQVQDSNGNVVDVKAEATGLPQEAYNEQFGVDYEDALAKVEANEAVNAALDSAFAALGNGDRDLYRDIIDVNVEGTIPAGGLYVPLLPAADGAAYVIAHWNGTTWEVLQTKVENGVVYALFPESFSPVYLSILTVTGEENNNNDNNNNNNNNNNNSGSSDNSGAPASPKTGETLPVAGILAVVCLAGVAVCAKKACRR